MNKNDQILPKVAQTSNRSQLEVARIISLLSVSIFVFF